MYKNMKKLLITLAFVALGCGVMAQSVSDHTIAKRDNRRGMVLKEWNTAAGSKRAFLDRVTTYDELGRKIEEIEYASYGQKKRVTYEYEGNSTKCVRQVEYDDKNHAVRIEAIDEKGLVISLPESDSVGFSGNTMFCA